MKLRHTLPALADLESVLDYITQHPPQGARHVQSRIQTIIDVLPQHPQIVTRTSDPTIRRITILPYPYEAGRGKSLFTPSGMRRATHPICPALNPASLGPVTGFGPRC